MVRQDALALSLFARLAEKYLFGPGRSTGTTPVLIDRLVGHLRDPRRVTRVQHDVGAGARQPDGEGAPDPLARTGDERRGAGEVEQVHRRSRTSTGSRSSYAWFSPPIAHTNE